MVVSCLSLPYRTSLAQLVNNGHGASVMDFITEVVTAWNERWEAITVSILAILAVV